jgi:hypothetical protein
MSRENNAGDFDEWARRQAVQVVSQLPEGFEEALAILDQAKRLVHWLREKPAAAPLNVVSIAQKN